MKKNLVYVVLGPTATGKTKVAVEIAKKIGGEVISADSMQIYQGMDIGTAKPSVEEMQGILHHMIDVAMPDEPYTVALFQKQAGQVVQDVLARGKVPIIAGGTGLYVNALTYELDFTKTATNHAYRKQLEAYSSDTLHSMLAERDEESAQRIHPNDRKRLIRRLEILEHGKKQGYDFQKPSDKYTFFMAGLTGDRQKLYHRINMRVDDMFAHRLEDEAKAIYDAYGTEITAMQAIGYKEFIEYFTGSIAINEVCEHIKRNTRRFAKRQLTWFRRDDRIHWYDIFAYDSAESLADRIVSDSKKENNVLCSL